MGLDRLVGAEAQWLTTGWLDLDDVGTQLCEQKPAIGAIVDLAQFEDPDAVECPFHDRCHSRFSRRTSL
jgi:hypothetical protein